MRLSIILFFLIVVSCNYFETKKLSSEEILEEEIQTINWNDVDEYPSFSSCDSTIGKDQKKECFFSILRDTLSNSLSENLIIVSEDVDDELILTLLIDNQGIMKLKELKIKEQTREQIPHLDSLLREGLQRLPKIFPAIKRSQQVNTEFKLPIVISIQED